jgi:SNF2 family DNA or RNA helicase/uncharacterized Zn finger protein
MATQYGKTWWGGQFLNALSQIDYSNRLPRGRRYANNGSVKEINIIKNTITAKVKGSMPRPYNITITVPEFDQKQKSKLINEIVSNPLLLSKLLNKELPQELNDIALREQIQIFPRRWNDFRMNCSCPDSAVPCKHLAAVIYLITNEIDRNPFKIFELHGLNVLQEIEKSGFISGASGQQFSQTKNFIQPKIDLYSYTFKPELLEKMDFSTIPDLRANLLSLLDEKPLFTSKDFKKSIEKLYKLAAKEVAGFISDESESADHFERFENVEIHIHPNLHFKDALLTDSEKDLPFREKGGIEPLIQFIHTIPAKDINKLAPGLVALKMNFDFCLQIIQKSAFIPQLVQNDDNSYLIRWIPARMDDKITSIYKKLVEITPPDLLQINITKTKTAFFKTEEQVNTLCSLFINYFIQSVGNKCIETGDKADLIFFKAHEQTFDKLGEAEIPGAIQQWLSNFYITHKTWVPVLQLNDTDDGYFQLKVLIENQEDSLKPPVALDKFMQLKEYAKVRMDALKDLNLLAAKFKALEKIVASGGKQELSFSPVEFATVLLEVLPVMQLFGVKILLPNTLKSLIRPSVSLSLTEKKDNKKGATYLSLDQMLNFSWMISLGSDVISPQEFLKLIKNLNGVVKIKNNYVLIDPDEIKKMMERLENPEEINNADLLKAAVSEEYERSKISISPEARKILDALLKSDSVDMPQELLATLRPYQERGFEWLYKNCKVGFGSILADDMGLGKTLQVIAILLKLKQENELSKAKALVVVPTTLLTNWQKEISKFAPTLSAHVYHGSARKFDTDQFDILITTYGIARSDVETLNKHKWNVLIIDEAQNIKNPETAQTKAIKKIKAPVRIAMSGTPVENRLSEYWSIFDFTNKGYLGSLKTFKKEFALPIELTRDQEKLDLFKKISSPFILRRLKTDKTIISDLPEKIENDVYSALTKEQAAIYQNVIDELFPKIEEYGEEADDTRMKRQGMIFKLMIALKQICNHPNNYLKKENSEPELSGKAMLLMEHLENIYELGEKVLIFTQFKEMGDLLEKMIKEKFDTPVLFLHGEMQRNKRDEMVNLFQTKRQYRTFILSIKAGGTGLNLTAANHVIHYDLWWNPAVESQATDRAFRIGQEKNVMVYRFITQGTFEERINEMIQAKKQLADLTVASGEKWIGQLSDNELKELIAI